MADRMLRKDAESVGRVVAFCDRVKAILEGVVHDVDAGEMRGLDGRAEELKQWAGLGMSLLGDAVPADIKADLSAGLQAIAARLDGKALAAAREDERRDLAIQVQRGMGQLGGLADVLRFSLESRAAAKPKKGFGRLSLGSWATETGAMIGASVTTAVLAAGASKIPVVGDTLASLMQGTVPESEDGEDG